METKMRRVNAFMCCYVDKDVQMIFLPLNVMQNLSLNPKYQIQNNFVDLNDLTSNLISFCGLVMFLILNLYRIGAMLLDENMQRYQTVNFLYFATVFDSLYYAFGYVMNFILHYVHSKDNVRFILTFQNVHRIIHSFASTKLIIGRHWLNVITLFVFHIITCIYVYIVYLQPPWYVMFYVLVLLTIDCNMIYTISLIKLLTDKTAQWNTKVLVSLIDGSRVLCCNRMGYAYVKILDCYNIYKKVFQLPVLYHTVETFFLGLIKVQVLINFLHFYSRNPECGFRIVQGLLYVFMLKCLLIQILLCYYTHAFHDAMKISQDLCVHVLASNCTDEERKLCKNIQRLHRASYSKMSACGLFCIDISQLLRVIALLTNYTVVLLQFALL